MDIVKYWQSMAYLGGAVLFGILIHYILFTTGGVIARRTESPAVNSILTHCRAPLRPIIPLLMIHFGFPILSLPPNILAFLKQTFGILLMLSFAWLAIKLTDIGQELILNQFKLDVKDNLRARRIHTQIGIFKKIILVIVSVLMLAAILMTFDKIRYLGTSLLASAGIAGIIIGLAAQRSIATLLAGIQIAFTQPIRIDDVVIVENEWGRIEEITLTYVVVRIWDLRRLILPITYFMEKPFQNWTRISADILGTVFLYVDYTVPVQPIREELHRILKDSDLWDGKVWGLQTTSASERTVELRALMSAADASNAWNLRCTVREKLIEFIQKHYPDGLPRVRAEVEDRRPAQADL